MQGGHRDGGQLFGRHWFASCIDLSCWSHGAYGRLSNSCRWYTGTLYRILIWAWESLVNTSVNPYVIRRCNPTTCDISCCPGGGGHLRTGGCRIGASIGRSNLVEIPVTGSFLIHLTAHQVQVSFLYNHTEQETATNPATAAIPNAT